LMDLFFEILSWIAMVVLVFTGVPQILLNFKRKSTEGVSWLTFGLLLFGMGVLFLRSLFYTTDPVIRLNYGVGSLIILIINLQFIYYRLIKKQ